MNSPEVGDPAESLLRRPQTEATHGWRSVRSATWRGLPHGHPDIVVLIRTRQTLDLTAGDDPDCGRREDRPAAGSPGYCFVVNLNIQPLTTATWPALAALFEEGGDPRWVAPTTSSGPAAATSPARPRGGR
jgi:hypothetical protein